MPPALVKSLAKTAGKAVQKAEELWVKAKQKAEDAGRKLDYAYIVGILKSMLGLSTETLISCGWPISLLCEAEAEEHGGEYFFYVGEIDNELRDALLGSLDELGLRIQWHFLEGELLSVERPSKAADEKKLLKLFAEYDLLPQAKNESRQNILISMVLLEAYRVEKLGRSSVLLCEHPDICETELGYNQDEMETLFPGASPELIKMLIGER